MFYNSITESRSFSEPMFLACSIECVSQLTPLSLDKTGRLEGLDLSNFHPTVLDKCLAKSFPLRRKSLLWGILWKYLNMVKFPPLSKTRGALVLIYLCMYAFMYVCMYAHVYFCFST